MSGPPWAVRNNPSERRRRRLLWLVLAAGRYVVTDDVVTLLGDFLDHLGAGPVMLLGHSYGAYLARGVVATARRYRDHVVPGTTLVDETALGRIFAGWTVDVAGDTFSHPALIAAEDAGHALMHERPDLLATLLGDWLDRAFRAHGDRPPRQNLPAT